MKICCVCGGGFQGQYNQKTCSLKCRRLAVEEYQRVYQRVYRRKHPIDPKDRAERQRRYMSNPINRARVAARALERYYERRSDPIERERIRAVWRKRYAKQRIAYRALKQLGINIEI